MKYALYIVILLSHSKLFQASELENQLNRPLVQEMDINDQISQHLLTTAENRKKVLLNCAQILTTSKIKNKITREDLKDVCRQLPQVLLDLPADKNVNHQVNKITTDFQGVTCSSCYGLISCWKSYSNARVRQEAIDLKNAINASLQDIDNQSGNLYSSTALSHDVQTGSTPVIATVLSQTSAFNPAFNPAFVQAKHEN